MAFNKIMWGTIFLFDFRLNGLDILPDFIGFILIFFGLSEIVHLHKYFNTAKIISGILIVPSIFSIYENQSTTNNINPIMTVIGIVYTVLYLIYAYHLYCGIRDKALECNQHELAGKADLVWKLIILVNVSILLALLIPFLVIPIFILSIIVIIYEVIVLKNSSEIIEY